MNPPIVWQSLERELAPAAPYIRGDVLNAGSGSRDLHAFVQSSGGATLTCVDLGGADHLDVAADVHALPFTNASFDSVICNAVLEHVRDPEQLIRELLRVSRDDATLIVTVPFLQPFHASPTDFQRLTTDGLASLGGRHGLETLAIHPVHSAVHMLAWILWEVLSEGGHRKAMRLAWAPIWIATRLARNRTTKLRRNASAFQVIYRKTARSSPDALGR